MLEAIDECLHYTAWLVTGNPDHLTVDEYQSKAYADPLLIAKAIESNIDPSQWQAYIDGINDPRAKAVVSAYLQYSERLAND
jgi:hypothetical protein